ncbi:hypothetical protein [Nocardia sp. NPDC004750]
MIEDAGAFDDAEEIAGLDTVDVSAAVGAMAHGMRTAKQAIDRILVDAGVASK